MLLKKMFLLCILHSPLGFVYHSLFLNVPSYSEIIVIFLCKSFPLHMLPYMRFVRLHQLSSFLMHSILQNINDCDGSFELYATPIFVRHVLWKLPYHCIRINYDFDVSQFSLPCCYPFPFLSDLNVYIYLQSFSIS